MSLRAPIAVPVQIRADARVDARRAFRLAWNVGEDGLRLAGDLPFERGRVIEARFRLPSGETLTLAARITAGAPDREDAAEKGELEFLDPPSDARVALRRYVMERLGLPA